MVNAKLITVHFLEMNKYFFLFNVMQDNVKGVNTAMSNIPGQIESIESVFLKPIWQKKMISA